MRIADKGKGVKLKGVGHINRLSILTESRECDESGDHEHWMQIKLQFWVIGPGESSAIVNDPENGQNQGANQQDRGQDHNHQVFEP